MDKTIAERIAEAKDELRKMDNLRKRLIQSQKVEIRRQRTRRLIERGAIVESLIGGADALTNEQFKSLMEKILTTDQAQRVIAETKCNGIP
jgi:predicted DNA-binding helix-hairpin-helix protein